MCIVGLGLFLPLFVFLLILFGGKRDFSRAGFDEFLKSAFRKWF